MFINIVIPIYNSDLIEAQLKTIENLDYDRELYQVIYVDDGSDTEYQKKYKKILQAFSHLPIEYHFF